MRGIETAFIGTLAADPEQRTSKAGRPWVSFRVAVSTDKEGSTTWLRCATFSETAMQATAQLTKGSRVYVEGSLKQTEYTDREGQTRTGLDVTAWKVEPVGQIGRRRPARESSNGGPTPSQGSARRDWQAPSASSPIAHPEHGGDRIPF